MEEVLKSQELQAANRARAAVKSSVTKAAKKLKSSLTLDAGQKYNYATINKLAIQEDYSKLKGNLNVLKDSHDKYVKDCLKAAIEKGVTAEGIEAFETKEDSEFEEYRNVACEAIGLYEFEFKTGLDQYLKNIQEEAKVVPTKSVSNKSKADAKKMLSRWFCIKEQWKVLIEDAQDAIKDISDYSKAELDKKDILFDATKSVSEIETEWKVLSDFHLT